MNYKELDHIRERAEDFMREEFTRVIQHLDNEAYKLGLAFDAQWEVIDRGVYVISSLFNEEGEEVASEEEFFPFDCIEDCLAITLPTVK